MTRWSDDDIIARLTDPRNTHYRESVAKQWTVINIPAIMDNEDIARALGKKVGDALWPERFPLDLLATARDMDPYGFSALSMGRPTPPEGAFYKQNDIYTYDKPNEFPKNSRMYQTGDLAVSVELTADKSCVGTWGLDQEGVLWLHPDLYWERRSSDESVDEIINRGKDYSVMEAFYEKGQLDKAVGPFLEKRMAEKKAYFTLTRLPVAGNKGMRSLSLRGRMRQGKVRFPSFAPWWPTAKEQLLKFTGSGDDKEDDFCDMCALIGQAMEDTVPASKPASNVIKMPRVGTLAWVKWASDKESRYKKRIQMRRGM
jgi:predicted phage terminase large subunit-like protein